MHVNLEFWKVVAAAWDRTISGEEAAAVATIAGQVVNTNSKALRSVGTFNQIPSALDAILNDEDDNDD